MTLKQAAAKLQGKVWATGGKGLWSSVAKPVRVLEARASTSGTPGEPYFEEYLQVYFSPDTWDVMQHGLIYTDQAWLAGLRKALREVGYEKWNHLNYTEQGMQGEEYVHLIVGSW